VIVLAGPGAAEVLRAVFRPFRSHRQAGEGLLQLGYLVADDHVMDEAVVCRAGGSIEINIHGGPQVAKAAMELLSRKGVAARPAPAAALETFTPAHPRWDNPAVGRELLRALPSARGPLILAALTQQWSAGITRLAREVISHLAGPMDPGRHSQTQRFAGALRRAADGLATMQRVLAPAEVVIAGPPNTGKSTLINALVGRQVSIVHDTPGTTRDWVRELALLEHVPVWLTDTAGIWQVPEGIDAEAVRRARHCAEKADLVLLTGSLSPIEVPSWLHAKNLLRAWTKCDLRPPEGTFDAAVSALTGEGLKALGKAVLRALALEGFDPAAPAAFTRRQADLMSASAAALEKTDLPAASRHLTELLQSPLDDK